MLQIALLWISIVMIKSLKLEILKYLLFNI